jgi:ABC-type uncharacterized transport system
MPALLAFSGQAPESAKPKLHILTALPLFWGEDGVQATLQNVAPRSSLITLLAADYDVQAIDALDAGQLAAVQTLIAIQPSAMAPEELVALDDWVRSGGKAVIFADPDLVWPSNLPMGDRRRAPISTLLDPLFAHWGLRLDGIRKMPTIDLVQIDGHGVAVLNAGIWIPTGKDCVTSDAALVADCRIESGRAILVADADMVDPRLWSETNQHNFAAIKNLIKRLETQVEGRK